MLWAAVLVLAWTCACHAGVPVITARSPVTYVLDGQILQNQTLTVQCSADAFGQSQTFENTHDGTTETVTVTCSAAQYVYDLQLVGYVPLDGRLNVYRACKVRNPGMFPNSSNSLNIPTVSNADLVGSEGGGGAGRRLLMHKVGYLLPADYKSISKHGEGGCLEARKNLQDTSSGKVASACVDSALWYCYGQAEGNQCVKDWIAKRGNPLKFDDSLYSECEFTSHANECAGELAKRQVEQFQEAAKKDAVTFAAYMSNLSAWQTQVLNTFGNLTNADAALLRAIEVERNRTLNVTSALQASIDVANMYLADLSNITQKHFVNLTGEMNAAQIKTQADYTAMAQELQNNFGQLQAGCVASLELYLRQAYRAMDNMTTLISDRILASENEASDLFARQVHENRNIYRAIRELTTIFRDEVELRQFQKDLIARVRAGILSEIQEGRHPFLPDTGVEPQTFGSQVNLVTIEVVRIAYATTSGLSTTLRTVDHAFKCDSRYIVTQLATGMTWFELLSRMGPTNCVTQQTPATGCACFVEMASMSCAEGGAGRAHSDWTNGLSITPNTCGGNTIVPAATQYFTSAVPYIQYHRTLCQQTTGDTFSIGARYTNRKAQFSNSGKDCDITEERLEFITADANPIVAFLGFFEVGFANVVKSYDVMFDYINGVLPSMMEYTMDPFQHSEGATGRCVTASFVSATPATVPVYRVVPVGAEASITVQQGNRAPVTITDVVLSVAQANLLPNAEYYVIGDPRDNFTVYDVPLEDISLAPTEYARRGKVTYLFTPTGANDDAYSWVLRNGVQPKHSAATNFPSAYATSINPVTNECQQRLSASLGSWCTLRTLYNVQPAVTNSSRLSFVPRSQASFTGQITLANGDVTAQFVSVCPMVTTLPQGAGTLVSLTNPLNTKDSNQVALTVDYPSEAPSTCERLVQLAVPAGGSTTHFVPRCVGALTSTLSVFRVTTSGDLVACEGATNINIGTSSTIYSTVYGNVGAYYVNLTTVTTNDDTLARLQALDAAIIDQMINLLIGYTQSFQHAGLPVPSLGFEAFLNATRNTTARPSFPPLTTRDPRLINLDVSDFDRLTQLYSAREAEAQRKIEAAANSGNDALAAARAANDAALEATRLARNMTSILQLSAVQYTEAHLTSTAVAISMYGALRQAMAATNAYAARSGGGLLGLDIVGTLTVDLMKETGKGLGLLIRYGSKALSFVADIIQRIRDEIGNVLGIFGSFFGMCMSFVVSLVVNAFFAWAWAKWMFTKFNGGGSFLCFTVRPPAVPYNNNPQRPRVVQMVRGPF